MVQKDIVRFLESLDVSDRFRHPVSKREVCINARPMIMVLVVCHPALFFHLISYPFFVLRNGFESVSRLLRHHQAPYGSRDPKG